MKNNTDDFLDFIIKIKNNEIISFDDLNIFYSMMKESSFYDFKLLEYIFIHIEANISNGATITKNMLLTLYDIKDNASLYGKNNEDKIEAIINDFISTQERIERLKENDVIGSYINNILSKKSVDEKKYWYSLIKECRLYSNTKINKKFHSNLLSIVNNIGLMSYKETFLSIMSYLLTVKIISDSHVSLTYDNKVCLNEEYVYISKENINTLRGFIYSSIFIMDDEVILLIENLALRCFSKILKHGFLSLVLANASLYVLSESKMIKAVSSLSYLNVMVKDKNVQKKIELYLLELATYHKMSVHDIEDLAVSDFGLTIL